MRTCTRYLNRVQNEANENRIRLLANMNSASIYKLASQNTVASSLPNSIWKREPFVLNNQNEQLCTEMWFPRFRRTYTQTATKLQPQSKIKIPSRGSLIAPHPSDSTANFKEAIMDSRRFFSTKRTVKKVISSICS